MEARRSKITAPVNLVSVKFLFLTCKWLPSHCALTWQKEPWSLFLSYKGTNPSATPSPLHLLVIVQWLSYVQLFATPRTAACQASLSFTTSQSLLKLKSIELMMPSNHLILCHPLLLLPSIFPSIRASGSFSMNWLFASGDQSIEATSPHTHN